MAIREIKEDGKTISCDIQVAQRHPVTKKKKQFRAKARTKWEAGKVEFALKEKLRDFFSGNIVPSWSEFVTDYETNCLVNKAASTRHNELSILTAHAKPLLSSKTINQVNEDDIRTILGRVAPDRSLSLKHNIRKCLANVFNYAIERRFINDNPCRRIKLSKIPEPALNILTDSQIRQFLKKAEETGTEWFSIWAFGIYSGLRSGELIALRYKHLDHNEGRPIIKVQESWTKQGGYKPFTKNKRVRSVPINASLQRVIDRLRSENPTSCAPDDFVLPQLATWRQGDASKELRAFLAGCGLPAIRFHDLRSCFISQCLLNGVTPSVVMKMVGHSEMKTMMRYCRHTGSDVLGQTDVLDFS